MSKTIKQLKERIASQDKKIAQLESDLAAAKGQIETLNTQVANLAGSVIWIVFGPSFSPVI